MDLGLNKKEETYEIIEEELISGSVTDRVQRPPRAKSGSRDLTNFKLKELNETAISHRIRHSRQASNFNIDARDLRSFTQESFGNIWMYPDLFNIVPL